VAYFRGIGDIPVQLDQQSQHLWNSATIQSAEFAFLRQQDPVDSDQWLKVLPGISTAGGHRDPADGRRLAGGPAIPVGDPGLETPAGDWTGRPMGPMGQTAEYLTLPDGTARQQRVDKAGATPYDFAPLFERDLDRTSSRRQFGATPYDFAPLFERPGIPAETWCE